MSRWYSLHIKNEILFWFFTLALLPLIFLTSINYIYQEQNYENSAIQAMQISLDDKIKRIEKYISNVKKDTLMIANMPDTKNALQFYIKNQDKDYRLLKENISNEILFDQMIKNLGYHDLFLITPSGNIVYTVKKEKDLGENLLAGKYKDTNLATAFKETLIYFETQISEFDYYPPSDKKASFTTTPIYSDHKLVGLLALQINIDEIYNLFAEQDKAHETNEFFAAKLNSENQTILTTILENDKGEKITDYKFPSDTQLPINRAVFGESSRGITVDYKGNEIVAAWGYIPELRWGIVSKIDLNEVLQPADELKFYSILILFFVSLGIVVAILSAIKNIVQPIEKLTNSMQNFSKTKINENVNVTVENEIGDLAKNFNQLTLTLKESQDTIQKYANELEEKVKQRTTELQNAKNDIEIKNNIMEKYFEIINKYVISSTTDTKGVITKVSQAFCEITGYSEEELLGRKHNIIRHPDMPQRLYHEIWDTIKSGNTWQGEIKNTKKDGSFYWVQATISPVFNEKNEIVEFTSIRQEITDKKIVEEISITDGLTNIFNRRYFNDIFPKLINAAKRKSEIINFLLLDIDNFKLYNDNYGHQMGDEILIEFAKCLKSNLHRADDYCFRIGGEEFGVIFKSTTKEDAIIFANKVLHSIEAMKLPHEYNTASRFITASIGCSSQNADTIQDMNDIFKEADELLYIAKKNGRNRVQYNQ